MKTLAWWRIAQWQNPSKTNTEISEHRLWNISWLGTISLQFTLHYTMQLLKWQNEKCMLTKGKQSEQTSRGERLLPVRVLGSIDYGWWPIHWDTKSQRRLATVEKAFLATITFYVTIFKNHITFIIDCLDLDKSNLGAVSCGDLAYASEDTMLSFNAACRIG